MAHIEDEDVIEAIADKYGPKIEHMLEEISESLEEEGYIVNGPDDMSDDEPAWSVNVHPSNNEENSVDITVHIVISEHRDGEPNGMNFMLDVVSYGGKILGGSAPFNYTGNVWVPRDDKDLVEERWLVFQNSVDSTAVVDRIEGYYSSGR